MPPKSPNIILIVLDTVGAKHLPMAIFAATPSTWSRLQEVCSDELLRYTEP